MILCNDLVNPDLALSLVERISKEGLVSLDTETNGHDIRDGRGHCYGISIASPTGAVYLPFRHTNQPEQNFELQRFMPAIQDVIDKNVCIYHNAKFDLPSLETLGLKARGSKFVDTMILSHMVDENRPFQGKNLDAVTKFYLDDGGKRVSDEYKGVLKIVGYEGMPADITSEYAVWDAWLTYQLYQKLLPKLREEQLGAVWAHKAKFIELLISMEERGIGIDNALCEEMLEHGAFQMERYVEYLDGLVPSKLNDLKVLLIDTLGLPVVKLTPKGKPSFDKEAMKDYDLMLGMMSSDNKIAKWVLAYRGWQKATSAFYRPYIEKQSPVDGRLRTDYWLHGTVTGRMSSHTPNLQQIPKEGDKPWNRSVKQAFKAAPGYVLVEGDYKQLEFRLAAALAKEPTLLGAFNDSERDVFTEMGHHLNMTRDRSKVLTYLLSYGGGPDKIKYAFGVSRARGSEIRDEFYHQYPRLKYISNEAQARAMRTGKVRFWSGRYRHFLDKKRDAHKAWNSLMQGGAADIVERSMLRCADNGLNNEDCRMLLQVHDSIVFEIREDLVDKYKPEIQYQMEQVTPDFGVKFAVDVHPWSKAA